jgi:gamma-glutamyl hercynylcysteine S-oxide synthase
VFARLFSLLNKHAIIFSDMTTDFLPHNRTGSIDSPHIRSAGKELLSLALMDARNHTLHLFAQYEQALASRDFAVPKMGEVNPPLWELGHVAWFQEWWIGRNMQRAQGRHCEPAHARLASIEPHADRWYNSSTVAHHTRWSLDLPTPAHTKNYLLDTLEQSLELLDKASDDDDALYFYRLALMHEDMHAEAFVQMANTLGIALTVPMLAAFTPAAITPRDAIALPATNWQLGCDDAGFTFDNERGAHEVSVPAFEIDAQPVSWAQFVEFVDDGGYDRVELWQSAGWDWLQTLEHSSEGRRGPRFVEQIGVASGAVMQTRFGQAMRMASNQPAMHITWFEADAYARWAARRLPTEVEWELAAHQAAGQGFKWGDVWEWTASSFKPYPGFAPDPYQDYSQPWFHTHKAVRGASVATRARMQHPKYRNFYLPQRDDMLIGFRTCTL